jgi:hypothetical protein
VVYILDINLKGKEVKITRKIPGGSTQEFPPRENIRDIIYKIRSYVYKACAWNLCI